MTEQQDRDADKVIGTMVAGAGAASLLPGWNAVPFIAGMASGVVAIGAVYEIPLTRDEGWKLVKQFLQAGGMATAVVFGGGKLLSAVVATTGIGYGAAVAMDAALGTATAYAIGMAAKHYFRSDRNLAAAQAAYRSALKERTR